MASSAARITFRVVMVVVLLLVIFYVGRPLYWKISATVHDIRRNKQTVKEGFSQIVLEAQKSVGWYHDESDSGVHDGADGKKAGSVAARRLLHQRWKCVHKMTRTEDGSGSL
ncbi:uncharacterized protein LOC111778653 isoform X2 [Cucurbita pepo subsp. pepo]|uniref:uncharacterized protein LOC111778653 isoform X2 n=1 Tax=Cucurbita pepo subsp. pepo TaxID=3664 RepID=UPI000C9D70FB|nr:uncharacterized protein LOC111778653 isoform X2 [Cucurbita pepo subsp. pepo]